MVSLSKRLNRIKMQPTASSRKPLICFCVLADNIGEALLTENSSCKQELSCMSNKTCRSSVKRATHQENNSSPTGAQTLRGQRMKTTFNWPVLNRDSQRFRAGPKTSPQPEPLIHSLHWNRICEIFLIEFYSFYECWCVGKWMRLWLWFEGVSSEVSASNIMRMVTPNQWKSPNLFVFSFLLYILK